MLRLGFKRSLSIATVVATLSLSLVASLGAAPAAHAAGSPTVVQSVTVSDVNNSSTSLSATLPNVQSGDRLVALIGWGGGNSWSLGDVTQSLGTSADNFGDVVSSVDGLNDSARITSGVAPASGNDTITMSLNYVGCPGGCTSHFVQSTMTVIELSGAGYSDGQAYGADNGSGGTVHTPSSGTGLATGANEIDLGLYVDGGANVGLSVPSSESELGTKHDHAVSIEWDQASAVTQSSFSFDSSSNARYAAFVAASFPAA